MRREAECDSSTLPISISASRSSTASTRTGRNIRELDVTASFRALVDRVIAIAPDVMVIAGDVLHSVRPKNPVVIEAFIGVQAPGRRPASDADHHGRRES
jgi:hypothetical protein